MFSKKMVQKIWIKKYGIKKEILDYSGRKMVFNQFGKCWNIFYVKPVEIGGKELEHNLYIQN